jgi:hypothetical protein
MSIISDSEILDFLDITEEIFTIDASNDALILKYDSGASSTLDIADGSYEGLELATEIKSKIDTAFTITSTVTYSSTTRKFTITVTAGHTIQYINSGSQIGLDIGFTEDSSASQSITSDQVANGIDSASLIIDLKTSFEESFKKECRRTFEETSYTLEKYDGKGTRNLYLKNYPVITLDRLVVGTTEVIKIRNTSAYTSASVSVLTTGLRLVKDGIPDSTVTFASNTTMNAIVAAITALGSGWEASVVSTTYGNYKSTELLPLFGYNCIDSNWIYLKIPYATGAEYEFEVDQNTGIINRSFPFPKGFRNIFVDYSAGYSSDDMPEDIKTAIKIGTKYMYDQFKTESYGLKSYKTGDITVVYDKGNKTSTNWPTEVQRIIDRYRRRLV